MVKQSEEMKEESEKTKDFFKVWEDSYTAVSKMWEDSYTNLYKPWTESMGELFEKGAELSKEATSEKYKEFYDEWMQSYKNTFSKFYPSLSQKSDREALEKLMDSAEETGNVFKSWIARLEESSEKTRELFKGAPDPEKYRLHYNMWMKTYGNIFDEIFSLPVMESTKEIFENQSGIPHIYLNNLAQISKIWKNSYANLYRPMVDSMFRLSGKMAEITRGEAGHEVYKEFYDLWMDTYRETFGKLFNVESARPSKEMLENFTTSTNVYLNMYKSWLAALEKISQKTEDISKRTADPAALKEFYGLWVKTYEKAFDDFFENMPAVGPMKRMMEPVKSAAKMYGDTFASMSNTWMKTGSSQA
ncbi:MAG: hypothetical protein FIB08_09560 [Candidatus Methanoperedens sp.]|nr:hypothetical protein [Candidatus Methanoperedens sp.]